ncbi:alpha/beta hydrolase [Desulfogranum mediterraneum]|uniref:alpha/beta hydrolase n=1 Tax=Desulfogranum mediterraneum TaxID=160661 RepID=UPI001E4CB407|nr:alpha/beta hydrolase [Desulfogranum mediterraneum]
MSDTASLMDAPEFTQLLFFPRTVARNTPPEQAVDVDVTLEPELKIGCRIFTVSKSAPTIIFFHGNGEIVSDYDEIGPMYQQQGINFAVADYRGYGWSDGVPLVSTLLSDCNQTFEQLRSWLSSEGYSGEIFVMGRSLGSACAIEVGVNHSEELAGMIIESGFAHTLPLAQTLGMDLARLDISEEQTFNNGGKIEQFEKPIFMLHGQLDQLIPVWQAEKLHSLAGAKAKELQMVPGADHNSLIAIGGLLYFQTIRKFIDKTIGAVPDWRERRKQYREQQNRAGR